VEIETLDSPVEAGNDNESICEHVQRDEGDHNRNQKGDIQLLPHAE
jgi:hypothetical protein